MQKFKEEDSCKLQDSINIDMKEFQHLYFWHVPDAKLQMPDGVLKEKNVGCISITRNTSQEGENVGTIRFRKTVIKEASIFVLLVSL
ncbi:unnamed protein product [Callosobruchus maculatus]|uniref:Uncharacterized protein n=1 Tax=Callosobruchus maculatus TaxID=64391 RepID=A0A653D2Y8_CALMS|nr:unnamed protein product [Callosobruchus maculatus]